MIEFNCCNAQCKVFLRFGDELGGKSVKCPQCGQIQTAAARPVVIPQAPEAIQTSAPPHPFEGAKMGDFSMVFESSCGEPHQFDSKNPDFTAILPFWHLQRAGAPPARQNLQVVNEEILDVLPMPVQQPIPPSRRQAWDEDDYRETQERPRYHRNASVHRLLCPFCGREIAPNEMRCPRCDGNLSDQSLTEMESELKSQRSQNQLLSFLVGLPALGLQVISVMLFYLIKDSVASWVFFVVFVVGGIFLWFGIAFAVLYKRDNVAWALFGFLSLVGLIILCVIPDQKAQRLSRIKRLLDARDCARGDQQLTVT